MRPEEHLQLGMTAHRAGRLDEAERHYRKAMKGAGNDFMSARMLGALYIQRQQFGPAEAALAKANRANPQDASAQQNHAATLLALRRFNECIAASDRALALQASNLPALHTKACALMELAQYQEAISVCDAALALDGRYADGWYMRANALYQIGRHGEALECYERTIALQPNRFEALYYRAAALTILKRPRDALAAIDMAIAVNPHSAEAFRERGDILRALNRLDDAMASYDHALNLNPNNSDTLNSRGLLLLMMGRVAEGLAQLDRALAIAPLNADALRNRGQAYTLQGRWPEALQDLQRAVELSPQNALAMLDLARVLQSFDRYQEAVALFDRAAAIDGSIDNLAGGLLYSKLFLCDWRDFNAACKNLLSRIALGERAGTPFELLAIASTPAEQFAAAWNHTSDGPDNQIIRHLPRQTAAKIRLGYMSTDFRTHAVASLVIGLIERHDRERFELFAISLGPDDKSPMRARMEQTFEHFIDAREMTDDQIAETIVRLQIDILVDLNGHTEGARTGILARRPAPVQVNYLGYPGTMAVNFMDYIIADRILVPPDEEKFFSEKIVVMPNTYQPGSARRVSDHAPARAEYGLSEDAFVFCCFNNTFKITPDIFAIWMRILGAVDNSVLWLLNPTPEARANLKREAARAGIDPERLIFAPRVTMEDHIARHQLADLFLDTLHYTAHTTASDALWSGLPLITCLGQSFAARVSASLLHAAKLADLVAPSVQDYEALAIELARNPDRLGAIKRRLKETRDQSPLFDIQRFASDIERAYQTMWQRHQAGQAPQAFSVERHS